MEEGILLPLDYVNTTGMVDLDHPVNIGGEDNGSKCGTSCQCISQSVGTTHIQCTCKDGESLPQVWNSVFE